MHDLALKRRRTEKPISVPSKCPFKDEILVEAENMRKAIRTQVDAAKSSKKAKKVAKKILTSSSLGSH